jgi:hypothetical protein
MLAVALGKAASVPSTRVTFTASVGLITSAAELLALARLAVTVTNLLLSLLILPHSV